MKTATATRPTTFAERVSHSYDARTGIVHIALDDDDAGYLVEAVEDGVVLQKLLTRETHAVLFGFGGGLACDCKGWQYRRACRHATCVARMIDANEI